LPINYCGADRNDFAKTMSGHRSLKEIQLYTEAADQAVLSRHAIDRLRDGKRAEIVKTVPLG
jgi:hypothetical protein